MLVLPGDGVTGVGYAKRIQPGEYGEATMPHSEVCIQIRVAGKRMRFWFSGNPYPKVQLLQPDGVEYSGPITYGEAGIFSDEKGYYYYPNR